MDIGVPVFAGLDGEVMSVQDGMFDRNHRGAVLSGRRARCSDPSDWRLSGPTSSASAVSR